MNKDRYNRKLSYEKAKEIIEMKKSMTNREISQRFGVSITSVRRVVNGKSWKIIK